MTYVECNSVNSVITANVACDVCAAPTHTPVAGVGRGPTYIPHIDSSSQVGATEATDCHLSSTASTDICYLQHHAIYCNS